MAGGCSSDTGTAVTTGLDRAERSVSASRVDSGAAPTSVSVVAEVDGRAIRFEDLRAGLIESAAADVMRELILERRLAMRCERAGIEIGEDELARERELIGRAMIGAGLALDSHEAEQFLERVRHKRGLGRTRYASLIRTNAMLRALIGESAEPDESEIRRAFDAIYGERLQVRLITAVTLEEATQIARLARDGTDFSTLAARFSIDRSAERGGLLEPLSIHDESYPIAIRRAAGALAMGDVSGAIALESGYALLTLERVLPPRADAPDFESVRALIANDARLRRERILMAELANRVRSEGGAPSIFDAQIREAWERSRAATLGSR